jgi:hypothetical protein
MEFNLWRIIIRNEYGIIVEMITKIPILRKLIQMKHHHWNHQLEYICIFVYDFCLKYFIGIKYMIYYNKMNINEEQFVKRTLI